MADDKYTCFDDLATGEKRGEDYDFESRSREAADAVVIAPHGGTIEPWTDKIADAIAGEDFSFYCFKAFKKNSGLHIASRLFDEPTCVNLVAAHQHVVSIHGWGAAGERVCVGGRDTELITALKGGLLAKGIHVEDAVGPLRGTDPDNITNRGASGRGVQFELTMDFRTNAVTVRNFTKAVRTVLLAVGSERGVSTKRRDKGMNADEFIKAVSDPDLWVQKSMALRQSADKLWEEFFRSTLRGSVEKPSTDSERELERAFDYLSTAKMLYGLAIETALKGHLIRTDPVSTNIQVQMDGAGRVVEAELKQIGVSVGHGHNLVQLAEKAGAIAAHAKKIDITLLRNVLQHLTECITWSGKYPAPRRSGSPFEPDPNVPLVVFQHYIRDVIDPFLDSYHPKVNSDAASVETLDRMFQIVQEERKRREASKT